MTRRDRSEALVRWYPPSWRERYGEELRALLEDTYASGPVPLGERLSTARAGLAERARAAGLIGRGAAGPERARAGAILALAGWSMFLLAGCGLAKFAENWRLATPRAGHGAGAAFGLVEVGGAAGSAMVILAALASLRPLAALVREGRLGELRRPFLAALVAAALAVAATGGLASWAHHLDERARNGGSTLYSAAFVVWALLACAAFFVVTLGALACASRLSISVRLARAALPFGAGLVASMLAATTGLVWWWVSEAEHAPAVLSGGIGAALAPLPAEVPLPLVLVGSAMLLGLALGCAGLVRVKGATRAAPAQP